MEEERTYTKKDFQNVIERYLYAKTLTDEDKKVLENLPFCKCVGFEGNDLLKKRYEEHLYNLALSKYKLDLNGTLPDYLMVDVDNSKVWYHPEYWELLPPLENIKIVTLYDADDKEYVIESTIGNVERTLLKRGYRFIRVADGNLAVYFKG